MDRALTSVPLFPRGELRGSDPAEGTQQQVAEVGSELQTLSKPQVSRHYPQRISPFSGWCLSPFSKGVSYSVVAVSQGLSRQAEPRWGKELMGGMGKG